MTARDEVLARVRSALAGDTSGDVEVPRAYRTHGEHPAGTPALLDLLADRLADYRAGVRRTTGDGLAVAVAEALADGLRRGEAGQAAATPRIVVPPGLPPEWLAAAPVTAVVDERLGAGDLDGLDGVVTAAAVAIAETGTIVLDASPDQGRRALSLVPDLHVCVVHAHQVVAGVPEALSRLDPTRPLTWISGPSATSDIELNRVEGVHGPRTLEVILVEASAA